MQFSEFAQNFVTYLERFKGYSGETVENYEAVFGQYRGFLQIRGLRDEVKNFTGDLCQEFAQYLATGGNKSNSIHVKMSALSSLGRYGMKTKHPTKSNAYVLNENPMTRVELPQRQRTNRKFLHRDELKALMDVDCAPPVRLSIDLFMDTGLRVSEVTKANVGDLWQDGEDRLVLNVTVKGRGRSQEKVAVPLGKDIAEKLLKYLQHREAKPTEPLIVNSLGNRYVRESLSSEIARAARRAGITRLPVRAHALRHTYNVIARVEAKLDGVQRGGLLNQTDTSSIEKYDHLLPSEATTAREAVRAGVKSYIGA